MAFDLLKDVDPRFWKKARLETYTKWPFTSKDDTCTPERMASAGFYVVDGEEDEDTVQCFICGKQLDGWEASDDPWKEHQKHQKDCPFIQLNKQDELEWTIEELFCLVKAFYVKEGERNLNRVIKKMKEDNEIMKQNIIEMYKKERGKDYGKC